MTDPRHTPEALAQRVKAWREAAGLTAAEAAAALEIPASTLRNIEYGRGFPYPALLLAGISRQEIGAKLLARARR